MSTPCNNSARFVNYRPISDVSSDLTIEVGASSFALHKVNKLQLAFLIGYFIFCILIMGIYLYINDIFLCRIYQPYKCFSFSAPVNSLKRISSSTIVQ